MLRAAQRRATPMQLLEFDKPGAEPSVRPTRARLRGGYRPAVLPGFRLHSGASARGHREGRFTVQVARGPVPINVVISNVPGPPLPLYLAGARLVAMLPLGPPIDGAGLNITVLSYIDRIDWGFIACRELAPRLQDMAHAVEDSHNELLKAARV